MCVSHPWNSSRWRVSVSIRVVFKYFAIVALFVLFFLASAPLDLRVESVAFISSLFRVSVHNGRRTSQMYTVMKCAWTHDYFVIVYHRCLCQYFACSRTRALSLATIPPQALCVYIVLHPLNAFHWLHGMQPHTESVRSLRWELLASNVKNLLVASDQELWALRVTILHASCRRVFIGNPR